MPLLLLLTLLCCTPAEVAEDSGDLGSDTDSDTDTDTDSDTDTDTDTDADTDTTFVPDGSCNYLDLDMYVLSCGGQWQTVLRFVDLDSDPSCPDFYTFGLGAYLDLADAYAAGQCDDTCVYQPASAVMFVYCEVRGEYTVYGPGGPGQTGTNEDCPVIQYFEGIAGSGWYDSFEGYQAENPCP